MEVKLAVFKGFREEKDVIIKSVPYEVGRRRTANLIIPHMHVSRKHCQIVNENRSWKVNDWSSSGTFVNDILVGKGNSAIINSGDSIRFGPVESGLCWTFNLLPDKSLVENCEPKDRILLNLSSEKQRPRAECPGVKRQNLMKDLDEVAAGEQGAELEIKEEFIHLKKIKELQKELEQVQSALNNIEEENSVLQEKLAKEIKKKPADLTAKILENLTDVMESEMQCTICSELFVTAVTLCCSHTFCKYCVDQWKKKQKTCPICRKKITKETRSLVIDNYIDKMVGNLSLELKERREAIIDERNRVPTKKLKYI